MDQKPKRNLLVTLADENYLDHTKQLFSSVYWNAGWNGDYMLLAHNVPEEKLGWFRDKGILIHKVEPLAQGIVGRGPHPACVASKFYLFQEYFKQWKNVVFLDVDIIVRASLDSLASVQGFAAPEATGCPFKDEFYPANKELWREFISTYDLRGPGMNSGILAFSTDIIEPDTFDKLMSVFRRFGSLNVCGEEGTFNIFFKKTWKMLPAIYNTYPTYVHGVYYVPYENIKAAIVHFVISIKPWKPSSPLHTEWLENYKKADQIDLSKPQAPKAVWTQAQAQSQAVHLALRRWFIMGHRTYFHMIMRCADHLMGMIGQVIRYISPRAYVLLKPAWKLPTIPSSAYNALFWASVAQKSFKKEMGGPEISMIIHSIVRPMNILVFGLNADSILWVELNKGRTFFIEDKPDWFDAIKGRYPFIDATLVNYGTRLSEWKSLLDEPSLLDMHLPDSVTATRWDIIIVDGPSGYEKDTPGRMKSIYLASKLAKKGCSVFIHDAEREVERAYCDQYFKNAELIEEVKGRALLKHYRIP